MKKQTRTRIFRVLLTVLCVVLLLAPVAYPVGAYFLSPAVYEHTFYGKLADKYDALYETEGEKIVVVGGSSVAFGYDSETLSELFDRPVVNFGLYAELGTKLMLDLAEDAIGAGDIVLLAPELDPETLSLRFNGSATLRALDGNLSMLRRIKRENRSSLFGALWSVAGEKLRYARTGAPDPDGVYNSRNFNEYGDISYTVTKYFDGEPVTVDGRENNVMAGFYDPTTPVVPDGETIVSPDFLDYLNGYIDRLTKKGARVYFAFCPVNAMALTENRGGKEVTVGLDGLLLDEGETKASISGVSLSDDLIARCDRFTAYLSANLHCPVLGTMTDHVYAPNYFFDTNFHLNIWGVKLHTAKVGNELREAEDLSKDELPVTAFLPVVEIPLGDMETVYEVGDLKYRLIVSDEFAVVGVSGEGMEKETVVFPPTLTVYDAKLDCEITRPVSVIATEAFAGTTKLKTVVIGDESRMTLADARAFANSSLVEIYLFCPVKGFTAGKDMLGGARPGFKIRVGAGLNYENDYSWGDINVEEREKTLVVTDRTFADFTE